jgi:Domain of unknown function (DUF4399)
MKINHLVLSLLTCSIISCNQPASENQQNSSTSTPENTGVYFVNLKDGDAVKSPVVIQMGISGMAVEPAGANNEGKGHYHIIIDGSFVEKGQMVPKDETHLHFGKGQTVDTLALSPGEHTLTLQFADGMHMSYGKDWSKTIKVNVQQ